MKPSLLDEDIAFFEGQLVAIMEDRGHEAGINAAFAMMVAAAGLAQSTMGLDKAKEHLVALMPRFVDLARARDIEAAQRAAMIEGIDHTMQ